MFEMFKRRQTLPTDAGAAGPHTPASRRLNDVVERRWKTELGPFEDLNRDLAGR